MKYKILENDTIIIDGETLYRIEALKDFSDVKIGDKGGYIQKYENLSQNGDSWIYENACAYENSRISGNSRVLGNSDISGNSRVFGDSWIFGDAIIKTIVSKSSDYITFGPFGDNNRMITYSQKMVSAGCFFGDVDQFKSKVIKKYGVDYGSYSNAIKILEVLK